METGAKAPAKNMSHHSSDPFKGSEIFRKLMEKIPDNTGDQIKDMQRKLQGEFPEGRLNETDEGALVVMIGHERGKVVMQFASPTAWIGFNPNQAMDIAQALIQHAREAGIVGVYELKL